MSAHDETLRRIANAKATNETVLDLGDLELTELPKELGYLPALQVLALGTLALRRHEDGTLKWESARTRNAQRFTNVDVLATLTNLRVLNLCRCEALTQVDALAALTRLRGLSLFGCEALTQVDALGSLTALRNLSLSHCNVTQVDALGKLTYLRFLTVFGCKALAQVDTFGALTRLQVLTLDGCEALTQVDVVGKLTSLRKLDLSFCKALAQIDALGKLTRLLVLVMRGCNALRQVDAVGKLTRLRKLDISFCKGLTQVDALGNLSNLRALNLSSCSALAQVDALGKLTSLRVLLVRNCTALMQVDALGKLTSLRVLALSWCKALTQVDALGKLTGLRKLDLVSCKALTQVDALDKLTGLRKLDLSFCTALTQVDTLGRLASLRKLDLSFCSLLRRFSPLCRLLRKLRHLHLFDCRLDDLPRELCGRSESDNVIEAVRAHYAEGLRHGWRQDDNVKVFILGNGGVGKTQLCRRLRGKLFVANPPSTPGIQVNHLRVVLPGSTNPIRVNLWDFGGQDIYHGTHHLFLHEQAVFILLWTPDTEHGEYVEAGARIRYRPLAYWLDYIRSLAGRDNHVLLVQGKCDADEDKRSLPIAPPSDFPNLMCLQFSAKDDPGEKKLQNLRAALETAVRDVLARYASAPIPAGRVRLADQIRRLLKNNRKRHEPKRRRMLRLESFRTLCQSNGQIEMESWLEALEYLHRSGVVYWRPDLFQGRVILDQAWALDAIYALFTLARQNPTVFEHGRFKREDLHARVWRNRSAAEQRVCLSMMESCGICFRCRDLPVEQGGQREWEYIAPELLPPYDSRQVQSGLAGGRLAKTGAAVRADVRYRFLHEYVLRRFLSWLGQHAGDSAVYWRFGCWFCEAQGRWTVVIDSRWDGDAQHPHQGIITIEAWGKEGPVLAKKLVAGLERLSPAPDPEMKPHVTWTGADLLGPATRSPDDQGNDLSEFFVVTTQNKDIVFSDRYTRRWENTVANLLALAELWLSWPKEEFNAKELADALYVRKKLELTPRRVLDLMQELQRQCDGNLIQRMKEGARYQRFAPGGKDRLAKAVVSIQAALDWHRQRRTR